MLTYYKGGGMGGGTLVSPSTTSTAQHSSPIPAPATTSTSTTQTQPAPPFDPKSLASWAAQRARAAAATQGINRMPGIFGNYAQLAQMDPAEVLQLFYPKASISTGLGLNSGVPFQRPATTSTATAKDDTTSTDALKKLLGMDSGTGGTSSQKDWGLTGLGPNQ